MLVNLIENLNNWKQTSDFTLFRLEKKQRKFRVDTKELVRSELG